MRGWQHLSHTPKSRRFSGAQASVTPPSRQNGAAYAPLVGWLSASSEGTPAPDTAHHARLFRPRSRAQRRAKERPCVPITISRPPARGQSRRYRLRPRRARRAQLHTDARQAAKKAGAGWRARSWRLVGLSAMRRIVLSTVRRRGACASAPPRARVRLGFNPRNADTSNTCRRHTRVAPSAGTRAPSASAAYEAEEVCAPKQRRTARPILEHRTRLALRFQRRPFKLARQLPELLQVGHDRAHVVDLGVTAAPAAPRSAR